MYQNYDQYIDSFYNRCNCNSMNMSSNLRLARAYVIDQPYSDLLPLNKALKYGTVFSNINLSFPRY